MRFALASVALAAALFSSAAPARATDARDHDAFGWNPSAVLDVIASNMLEYDVVRRPVATFQHQALNDFSWVNTWPAQTVETRVSAEPQTGDAQDAGTRRLVRYESHLAPGTIIVSTAERRLFLVTGPDEAISYGVGVGRPGFEWTGVHAITRKQEWPSWTPPADMLKRRPDLPHHMAGGIENPLGARAMYLGSTMYRIHGSNEPDSIGQAVSSGCLRMRNDDVVDLYERVKVGAKVIVL